MLKLVSNKIRCKFCGDILYSFEVHDFKRCMCGKCSIDGGLEYAQRSFVTEKPEDAYEDLSVYVDENGKLVNAKDADTKDIPLKPIRIEIKEVEAKAEAVWAVETIDVLADNSKELEAEAEIEEDPGPDEKEVVVKRDKNGKPISGRYPYGSKK